MSDIKQAYIIDAVRTPIGNFGGSLSGIRADDLAAHVIRELMKRNEGINPEAVEDVILGCANQAGEDSMNIARNALLIAGLPFVIPGETVNRLGASGMTAVIHARRAIAVGDGDLFIAGGVEHMTRAPRVVSKTSADDEQQKKYETNLGWRFPNPVLDELHGTESMIDTAENLAKMHHISRGDQDAFAVWSQQKAARAQKDGRWAEEIVPVPLRSDGENPVLFKEDEFLKPETTAEILARLSPVASREGSITAGNSTGLNDGAAALLIASGEAVDFYGLRPMARIVASAAVGVEPEIMGIGAMFAAKDALKRAQLKLKEMDIIEIQEAFASQALACIRKMELADRDPRINPNGGAIALGHPLGMSGARLLQSASVELQKQNKKYALVTMCVGVGQGCAVILERT